MNPRHTLMQIERDEDGIVSAAACWLDVSEFQVFELAWREWYGEPPFGQAVDRHFADYMRSDNVPSWVRHYARTVVDRSEPREEVPANAEHSVFSMGWIRSHEMELLGAALVLDTMALVVWLSLWGGGA